jgi:hypothetical protein
MIAGKGKFTMGLVLLAAFAGALITLFSPIFNGKNALQYLDALYNSISKGSAYYIPDVRQEIRGYSGHAVSVTLHFKDTSQAEQTGLLFKTAGATVVSEGALLKASGDLAAILDACLADADAMYHNRGEQVSSKYGQDERQVLYNWWTACKEMDKDFKKQKKFKEGRAVDLVKNKAVETAYNYYRIEPQNITDRLGVVIFSLGFYVLYTLWYGFAIMFLFEGWGMRLGH